MLAYDYPILGIFWTMLLVFVWISWLIIFFHVVIDIFRSHDMGGWAKAAWFLLVVLLPLLGVLIYVLARGDSMRDREIARARAQQDQMDAYVRQAAGTSGGVADELAKLSELKNSGVISDAEFETQKAKLLT
jgi:ABC-type multidrug transport system fused ATPase/permease subunit